MNPPLRFGVSAIAILPSLCLPIGLSGALPAPLAIEEAVQRANDYYIANSYVGQADWGIGAYQTGNMDAWATFGDPAWLDRALAFGALNQWMVGAPWPIPAPFAISGEQTHPLHADSHTAAQVYLDLYQLDPAQAVRKAEARQSMDGLVNDVSWSDPWGANAWADDDWGWVDAFYMAAPALARMANIENNEAYRTQLRAMYDTMKLSRDLFDDAEGLWYRDAAAKSEVSLNGEKVFWGRGNGWVMGGLVRVLQQLPAGHPDRAEFESMLQAMAAALVPIQGVDGFWRSSLLDPLHYPNPETSGTAFITYALAWGINNGVLDAATYQPVVEAAWNGLTSIALQPSGLLGYVQNRGRAPAAAGAGESHPYGVGAFLLAGTEVVKLAGGPEPLWPDAGDDAYLHDAANDYEAAFQLDATASLVRSGVVDRVSWWIGDIFLAEGWSPTVMLPRGTHVITARIEHDSGAIYEATVTKVLSGGGKLAVSGVIASADDGNVPANTIDGDFNTRWSAEGTGQWIRWDLGSEQPVSEIRLAWFRGNERQAYFDIQVSTDGSSWTDVLTAQAGSGATLGLEVFPFPEVTARYLRYVGYGNSSGSLWNSITEVEIHAPENGIPDDGDSLPDDWEIARLGTTAYGPGDNPFGKGRSLSNEYLAGTDPQDPTDRLQPNLQPTGTPGEMTFSFTARAAFGAGYGGLERRYTLWTSPDLTTGSWTVVPGYESIPGQNLPVEATVSLTTQQAFFRLSYELIQP
ncbi:MAG: glycoside hydrolase family 88 protein [Oceanipulchritudo sp.]